MPKLKISLLGPFEITQDGQPVTEFETDLARALLAYLAMHAGTDFSRETLATFFWPDSPTEEALHALRQTLNRLRSALGDKGAENNYLQITRRALQFHGKSDFWLDVTAFSNLVAATSRHPHRRLESCRSCNQQLLHASRLWRGDFLSTLNVNSLLFQEWRTTTGERLRIQAVETFGHLANYYEQSGDYEQSRAFAWRQLELESWREEAHRQLMRVLAVSGQRSAAIAQYKTCCRVLKGELRCEPEFETVALYEQIRSGKSQHQKPFHTNLPVYPTAFIGREKEMAEITDLLQHRDCHLLTLVGLGGMGKTRLAVEIAARAMGFYKDRGIFVSLGASTSSQQALTALARALSCEIFAHQDLNTQLQNYLRQKELLIVLDGFEHVLDAAEQISELLSYASGVQALVTSRERLNIYGEQVYEVSGLVYSQDSHSEADMNYSAAQLFIQTAQRVCPDFADDKIQIADICQLVSGMPLAIELAASWVQVLSCSEIAREIQRDLGFLQTQLRDIPQNHRSLQAVFASGWELLPSGERRILCQLSVFCGGFDRPAAHAVIAAAQTSVLAVLVNKAWLFRDEHSQEIRFGLHELVQRYAAQQLAIEPNEEIAARDRHSHYYAVWLSRFLIALKSNDRRVALEEIAFEIENVRAAWEWAISRRSVTEIDLMWESLFLFHDLPCWLQEGEGIFVQLSQAFNKAASPLENVMLGRGLSCQAWFASKQGHVQSAKELLEQAVPLLQETEARYDLALALCSHAVILMNLGLAIKAQEPLAASLSLFRELGDNDCIAMVLNYLSHVSYRLGDMPEALRYCQASLETARTNQLRPREAASLHSMGDIFIHLSKIDESIECYKQALDCYQGIDDPLGLSDTLVDLGVCSLIQGNYMDTLDFLTRALPIKQRIGDRPGEAIIFMKLGHLAARRTDYVAAQSYYDHGLLIVRETGDRRTEGEIFSGLSVMTTYQGDWSTAVAWVEQALHVFEAIGDKIAYADGLEQLGFITLMQGDFARAQEYLEQVRVICHELGYKAGLGFALLDLGWLFHYRGEPGKAQTYGQQALQLVVETGMKRGQVYALILIGHTFMGLGNLTEAAEVYRQAIHLCRELGGEQRTMEPLAGLADIALTQKDVALAKSRILGILKYLSMLMLDGIQDPMRVYLTCYQVLLANDDPRATNILSSGYDFLQARAARTSNEDLKRSFLENIPSHRELLAEWSKWIEG